MEHGYKHVIIYDEDYTFSYRIHFRVEIFPRLTIATSYKPLRYSNFIQKISTRNLHDVNTVGKISMRSFKNLSSRFDAKNYQLYVEFKNSAATVRS